MSLLQEVSVPQFIPVSEARIKLAELVRESEDQDVVLTKHGRPAAVLMSAQRHAELMELLDDLEDRLSVHEREGVTMDFSKLMEQLKDQQ